MKVMSFDLSTKCIGVVAFRLNDKKEIEKAASVPIFPPKFNPQNLGYKKYKAKIETKKGKTLFSYVKENETGAVSEAEKKRRDREVRSAKDIFVLEAIGKEIKSKIENIRPDLILVEKNAAFNGILTTVLLAKVMGVLLGIAGSMGISVEEYSVSEVRSNFNIGKLVKEFCSRKTPNELAAIPDITKRALREIMAKEYNIKMSTDDESDACVVFHNWYIKTTKSP